VTEVNRGEKRVPLSIVIEVAAGQEEPFRQISQMDVDKSSRDEIVAALMEGGIFAQIRSRPFNHLADPRVIPRSIFVKALESAPFVPSAEMQVEGHEKEFKAGLRALTKLTEGPVHLIFREGSSSSAFTQAEGVDKHTAEGPHPVANSSLHIQEIDPIESPYDLIWTLSALDVVAIGYLLLHGRYYIDRVISIAGPGILPDKTGFFKLRQGYPISALISGRLPKAPVRLVSGDPLMGVKVEAQGYMKQNATVFCAIPENTEREFLHFFRLGLHKYTFSRAYLSGHLDNSDRMYDFTTSLHGEHRPFIDSTLYDKVMPLDVPTMLLVKAVMAEDYELAAKLGLLEVDSEDFALPTFVCPSKMEMVDIIRGGLQSFAREML
jgi:Na+-transporting NADH:ubiquinone oxidoreductase subunit A